MAYTNPGGGESPKDDYFSDGDMPKESDDMPTTAVLPKSILAGKTFKPGDEVVLKIDRINEDSIEVSYAYGDEDDKGEHEEGEGDSDIQPPESMAKEPSMMD